MCWESKDVIKVNIEISENKQFQRLLGHRFKLMKEFQKAQAISRARETSKAKKDRTFKGTASHGT